MQFLRLSGPGKLSLAPYAHVLLPQSTDQIAAFKPGIGARTILEVHHHEHALSCESLWDHMIERADSGSIDLSDLRISLMRLCLLRVDLRQGIVGDFNVSVQVLGHLLVFSQIQILKLMQSFATRMEI